MRRALSAAHGAALATQSFGARGQYVTQKIENFIIVGITIDGKKFRPSDWAERLCGLLSAFDAQKKMKYSRYVSPMTHHGEKVVFVDSRLYDIEPRAYRFVLNFARDNELQLVEGSKLGPAQFKRMPMEIAA